MVLRQDYLFHKIIFEMDIINIKYYFDACTRMIEIQLNMTNTPCTCLAVFQIRLRIIFPDPNPSWYDDMDPVMDPASKNQTKSSECSFVLNVIFFNHVTFQKNIL